MQRPAFEFPAASSSSSSSSTFIPYQPGETSAAGRKRSASPVKFESGPGAGAGVGAGIGGDQRPTKLFRGPDTGGGAYRAAAGVDEEAARRLALGRAYSGLAGSAGVGAQGKMSDLFGRGVLRDRLDALAKESSIAFDDQALSYLSQAAEQRLRSLLSSACHAQYHRTNTSHHRAPPFASASASAAPAPSRSKPDEDDRPLWSHAITSDVSAVMDVLARQNKEAELAFRADRMNRIAREAEMARIREARERMREEREQRGEPEPEPIPPSAAPPPSDADAEMSSSLPRGSGRGEAQAPSTPREKAPASSTGTATPTFGAIKERTGGSSTVKKSGKKTPSADMSMKLTNMTAMRAIGGPKGKTYAWMNNPVVSSPLAGKKGKKDKGLAAKKRDKGATGAEGDQNGEAGDTDADAEGEEDVKADSDDEGTVNGHGGSTSKRKQKSRLNQSISGTESTPVPPSRKAKRPKLSVRTQRMVLVEPDPSAPLSAIPSSMPGTQNPSFGAQSRTVGVGGSADNERRLPDDRVLTAVDLAFALEREQAGKGMGSTEEVLWRLKSRPGGVWGRRDERDPSGPGGQAGGAGGLTGLSEAVAVGRSAG